MMPTDATPMVTQHAATELQESARPGAVLVRQAASSQPDKTEGKRASSTVTLRVVLGSEL